MALLRNLASALFERERIRTTLVKAKEVRPYAERLITLAKRDEDRLHARRMVARDIHDPLVVRKLFDTLGARYAGRPGGYTRILKLGPRRGDGAEMAILELLGSEFEAEKKKGDKGKKGAQSKAPAKAASKKGAATDKGASRKKKKPEPEAAE
jgi:large subunit ribosomal protein L17